VRPSGFPLIISCDFPSVPKVRPRLEKALPVIPHFFAHLAHITVGNREIGTGISEASKRVPIFPFDTQVGKQASSYFRQELGPSPRGSDPVPCRLT
jgi:hypothetical protein